MSPPLLSPEQDLITIKWIQSQGEIGHLLTYEEIRKYTFTTFRLQKLLSQHWVMGFCRKYPHINQYICSIERYAPHLIEWTQSQCKIGHPPTGEELRHYAFTTFHMNELPSNNWVTLLCRKYPSIKQYMRPNTFYTPEQKSDLIQWIYSQYSKGHPPTYSDIREHAVATFNMKEHPSRQWSVSFIRRNPELRPYIRLDNSNNPVFDIEQERILVKCIKHLYTLGDPLTPSRIQNLVASVKKEQPTTRWLKLFYKRHPGIQDFILNSSNPRTPKQARFCTDEQANSRESH